MAAMLKTSNRSLTPPPTDLLWRRVLYRDPTPKAGSGGRGRGNEGDSGPPLPLPLPPALPVPGVAEVAAAAAAAAKAADDPARDLVPNWICLRAIRSFVLIKFRGIVLHWLPLGRSVKGEPSLALPRANGVSSVLPSEEVRWKLSRTPPAEVVPCDDDDDTGSGGSGGGGAKYIPLPFTPLTVAVR